MSHRASTGRHLPVLLSVIAVALIGALIWLAWRSLEQDRALVVQRLQRRLDNTADLVVAALETRISTSERALSELSRMPVAELSKAADVYGHEQGEHAMVIIADSKTLDAYPANRLRYYPVVPGTDESEAETFKSGELLEFTTQDHAAAVAIYRDLAESEDQATRAGALLRLGRVLRKQQQHGAALETYDQLAELDSTVIEMLPADLLARHARCTIQQRLEQTPELEREAQSLLSDLYAGRWKLTRATYEFHEQQTRQRLVPEVVERIENSVANRQSPSLADGVESMWQHWQRIQRGELATHGNRFYWQRDVPVLLIWHSEDERLAALITDARSFTEGWRSSLQPVLDRQREQLAVADANGTLIMGPWAERGTAQALRTTVETRLPWTLQISSNYPSAISVELAGRRRLLLTGLAIAVGVIIAASFAIVRSVTRELEVARLQSSFVSAVSHEFRTPLASLCQLSELLVDGRVANDGRRQEYYQIIRRECERLSRLVESLLDFGRMEAGAREYRFERLDPATIVNEVAEEFSREIGDDGCRIDVKADPGLPQVQADHEAIGRAIWNLLDNANKYSPCGQSVGLRASCVDHHVKIDVQDHGMGIPTSEQSKVFEKFYRASTAVTAGVKGTGIGLAMVQQIVAAHGGELHVESDPNVGSTFTIRLRALEDRA